jgi:hypothetical protein
LRRLPRSSPNAAVPEENDTRKNIKGFTWAQSVSGDNQWMYCNGGGRSHKSNRDGTFVRICRL